LNVIKKSGLLRVFPQNCNGGHQTAMVTGLHHDGATFQPPIAAAISSTLNGASWAYGVAVESRTATL